LSEPITISQTAKLMADIKAQLPNQDTPNSIRCSQGTYDALLKHYGFKPDTDVRPGVTDCQFIGMSIFVDNNVKPDMYDVGYNIRGRFLTPIEAWAAGFNTLPTRPIKLEGQ
jgi:hypothetical protein